MEHVFRRERSRLWFKIFEETSSFNDDTDKKPHELGICANEMTKRLITVRFPRLVGASPRGWIRSRKNEGMWNLQIPFHCIRKPVLEQWKDLKRWGHAANSHIWLQLNTNIEDCFSGNELDFCVADDWNRVPDNGRTSVGEAEYQLKYKHPKGQVSDVQTREYVHVLKQAICECVGCLPPKQSNWFVTTIPWAGEGKRKLAYKMAEWTAKKMGLPFVKAQLAEKPSFKNLAVSDKIEKWREILSPDNPILLSEDVNRRTALIVDDLYQSGASIWCFAEYLKHFGADQVMAVVPVKALKDRDNT